jgi:hypothetical protein
MVFALVSIALGAPPPTGFTSSMERIALERTSPRVEVMVDPLVKTVVLTGAKISGRRESTLCPTQIQHRDGLWLHCTTRRLWAAIGDDENGLYLDLRALRGVTWQWDAAGVPLQRWPFEGLGIPESCPGTIDVAKAECALGEGRFEEAAVLFTTALRTPDVHFARLRLGDLALRRGDPEAALSWYAKAAANGPVSRLANLRECDLTGNCLTEPAATVAGLHPTLAMEARIHRIRQDLAANRDREAMQQLADEIEAGRPVCTVAHLFCQKAVQGAFLALDDETSALALTVFATAGLADGVAGIDVARAAAAAAERVGAPAYAAAVLASVSGRLALDELDVHLQQVARLYLSARDPVRAQVVVDYAEQKLSPATLKSKPWKQLRRTVEPNPAASAPDPAPTTPPSIAARLPAMAEDIAISRELARAVQVRSAAAQPPTSGGHP